MQNRYRILWTYKTKNVMIGLWDEKKKEEKKDRERKTLHNETSYQLSIESNGCFR